MHTNEEIRVERVENKMVLIAHVIIEDFMAY